jgi:pimeloyl-ACP methyl ester carboxylesterase
MLSKRAVEQNCNRKPAAGMRMIADFGLGNGVKLLHLGFRHALTAWSQQAAWASERNAELLRSGATLLWRQDIGHSAQEYAIDSWQRMLLTLDTLRRRGDAFLENEAVGSPPALDFAYEVIVDGAHLPRPVNYSLVRVAPPRGVAIDSTKRPFMIVDPRAGHGAGIGGFKPESQVGEAFEDGHAVYFVVFKPMPEPGQTLADVRDAEIAFLDEVSRRHPDAEKPVVVGNCQGGWGCLMLAASAPDKVGPLSINGAPVAYWAGASGSNPMRYTGGLVGGVAPALLMADLGGGVFDGSLLVQNFEGLNPANTYWKKLYGLYSAVDTEAERYLDFERWWGGFFMMNEEEIRWIVENLFIGNKLAQGHALLGSERIDLRRITTPIIVFASHGDNITPPPQALNWIVDLYRDVDEIKARGQRIIYMVHPSIGHLGIFVSAKIAGREHDAITDTMRAVEALPPGLYEMVLENGSDRVHIKFAPRTLDDILAMDDGRDDEEMFAAVASLSELGAKVHETMVRPMLRQVVTPEMAKLFFETRPLRMERSIFASRNPAMGTVASLADNVRAHRQPVAPDNPFLAIEKLASAQIEQSLNIFRDWRDAMQELTFHAVYGSPPMRMIGADDIAERQRKAADNLLSLPDVRDALDNIETGGEAEGTVRILELMSRASGYVRRSRLEKATELFKTEEPFKSMSETTRAKLIHRQALIVQFAEDRAKASLPELLDTAEERRRALDFVMRVAGPAETMNPHAKSLYDAFVRMLADNPLRTDTEGAPGSPAWIDESSLAFEDGDVAPSRPTEAAPGPADELMVIKGIGPKIVGQLAALGVRRFEQIAAWTPAEIAWVNARLDFPGRIQRERWVQQARRIVLERMPRAAE